MSDLNLKIIKDYVDKKVAGALTGKSAYEIAVEQGYEGTEEEWLASLVGETGDKGDKGDKGDTGAAGADWVPTVAEKTAIAAEAAGIIDINGKANKADCEGKLPVDFDMHAGLVDSRDLSLYGNVSLGNYHTCISVTAGEKYIINCRSSSSVYPGAFYTLNGVKVSAIFEDSATHLNAAITVPSGVDTLWINSKSTLIPLDQWKVYKVLSIVRKTTAG